jgi:tetratricopeptide (TPR) repeat protein
MELVVVPSRIGILGIGALLTGLISTGLFIGSGGGLAVADQKNPKLSALFDGLASARSSGEAAPIEQRIWQLWLHADDEVVNRTMQAGMRAMDMGDGAAALQAFDAAVAAKPDFAEAWNKRATLYYLLRRFPESIADIERTLELEPRHFGALSGLALIREAQNKPFEALEALERASQIYPQLPNLGEWVDRLTSELGEAI